MNSRILSAIVVCVLIIIHVAAGLESIYRHSVTVDEFAQVPAGISYLKTREFGMYPRDPPLMKLVFAVSADLTGVQYPSVNPALFVGQDSPWYYGIAFMEANRQGYHRIFYSARMANLAISALCGLCLYWAVRSAGHGPVAATTSLALWCYCPVVLAYATVATPDMGACLCSLLSVVAMQRCMRAQSPGRALLGGLALGLATAASFWSLVLPAVYLGFGFLYVLSMPRGTPPSRRISIVVLHLISIILIPLIVINVSYCFDGTNLPLREQAFKSDFLKTVRSSVGRVWKPGLDMGIPLPKPYLTGLDEQIAREENNPPNYFRGTWSRTSEWYSPAYTLAVKLPIGTILLVIASAAVGVPVLGRLERPSWLPLIAGVALFGEVSLQPRINTQVRLFLPVIFLLFWQVGRAVAHGRPKIFSRLLVATLIIVDLASVLTVRPHYLSYFNQISGGSAQGGEHLLDSNFDWGQDLFFLKDLMEQPRFKGKDLTLVYHGYERPEIAGVRSVTTADPSQRHPPKRGLYAISARFVYGGYSPVWSATGEQFFVSRDEYAYFRSLKPVAKAGYSILLYDFK